MLTQYFHPGKDSVKILMVCFTKQLFKKKQKRERLDNLWPTAFLTSTRGNHGRKYYWYNKKDSIYVTVDDNQSHPVSLSYRKPASVEGNHSMAWIPHENCVARIWNSWEKFKTLLLDWVLGITQSRYPRKGAW